VRVRLQHDAARVRFEQALILYRQVGAVPGEASYWCLGEIARVCSQHGAAQARFEEALTLYRQVGSVLGKANCIQGMGDIAFARSQHAVARARFEEALELYKRKTNKCGKPWHSSRLSSSVVSRGLFYKRDKISQGVKFLASKGVIELHSNPEPRLWLIARSITSSFRTR
jgi:hypothetical protein